MSKSSLSERSEGRFLRGRITQARPWKKVFSCLLVAVLVVGLAPQFSAVSLAEETTDVVLDVNDVSQGDENTPDTTSDKGVGSEDDQGSGEAPDSEGGDEPSQPEQPTAVEPTPDEPEQDGGSESADSADAGKSESAAAADKGSSSAASAKDDPKDEPKDESKDKEKDESDESDDTPSVITYVVENVKNVATKLKNALKLNPQADNDSALGLSVVVDGNTNSSGDTYYFAETTDAKVTVKVSEEGASLDVKDNSASASLNSDGSFVPSFNDGGKSIIAITATSSDASKTEVKELTLVSDNQAPVISIDWQSDPVFVDIDGKRYYKDERTAKVTVTEANFNGATTNIEVAGDNGAAEISDWTDGASGDAHEATVTFKDSAAAYKLQVSAKDWANNVAEPKESDEFYVDAEDPDISVDMGAEPKNGKYYNAELTPTITITESHFVDGNAHVYKNGATEEVQGEWQDDGNKHTFSSSDLTFKEDPNEQSLYVTCTDAVGKAAEEYNSGEFIVDTTEPTAKVEFSHAAFSNDGNTYYFDEDTEATITLEDIHFVEDPTAEPNITVKLDETVVTGTLDGDVWTGAKTTAGLAEGEHTLTISATDLAGLENKEWKSTKIVLDKTAPKVSVKWGDKAVNGKYYSAERTPTITIEEANFDRTKITVNGQTYDTWTDSGNKHTLEGPTFKNAKEAQKLTISGADRAGRGLEALTDPVDDGAPSTTQQGSISGGTYTSADFVVDTVAPKVEVSPSQSVAATLNGVDYFNAAKTLGITTTVTDDHFDPATEVDYVTNIATSGKQPNTAYSKGGWSSGKYTLIFGEHTQSSPTSAVAATVYDLAGNKATASYGKFALDITAPTMVAANSSKNIPSRDYSGNYRGEYLFYSSATQLKIAIHDDLGLKSVEGTGGDGQYTFSNSVKEGAKDYTVTVNLKDGHEFTSEFNLKAVDVSGNSRTWKINPKTGEVVDVSGSSKVNAPLYDRDPNLYPAALIVDTVAPSVSLSGVTAGQYYNSDQTVHLAISELNFRYVVQNDGGQTVLTIDKQEGNAGRAASTPYVLNAASMSAIDAMSGLYSYDQALNSDGHYTVYAHVTDPAGNQGEASIAEFTIDKTAPTIEVSWDNSNARNGMYYNSPRTATITITEHNFEPSDFNITTTGSISGWSSNGDTHTATVSYATDGRYTLSISGQDKAGNSMASYSEPEFVVDMTQPTISFADVEEHTAYNATIMPTILYEDEANFDAAGMTWTLTGSKNGAQAFAAGESASGNSGTVSFEDFPNEVEADDIYVLDAHLTDLAGNEAENSIMFSVNRFGSNFMIVNAESYEENDGYLAEPQEVLVQEINVSGAKSEDHGVSVTHGLQTDNLKRENTGKADSKGFYVESGTESYGWSSYLYHVGSGNFEDDGNYHVVMNSVDTATNKNSSANYYDPEKHEAADAEVSFILDQTDPLIEGLSVVSGGTYDSNKDTVSFTVTDNIGFKSVQVSVDGEVRDVQPDASGLCTVEIEPASFKGRSMKIIATDFANRTATEEVSDFHVTDNFFELNMFLIIGAIVVIAAAAGGAVYVRSRRS